MHYHPSTTRRQVFWLATATTAAVLGIFGLALAQSDGKHRGHGDVAATTTDGPVSGNVKVYVCASDSSVGQSWAGTCPLDGSPLVEREVVAGSLHDLHNATCPVMGSPAREEVFAIYKGTIVHFCCSGCASGFFARADDIVARLRAASH